MKMVTQKINNWKLCVFGSVMGGSILLCLLIYNLEYIIGYSSGYKLDFDFSQNLTYLQVDFELSHNLTHFQVVEKKQPKEFKSKAVANAIQVYHEENFQKPQDENCKKRFPTCIILGVQKCGTRELTEFLHLHPHIEIYKQENFESPYFIHDHYYQMGKEWFRSQMPCSYSNQITILKNSLYFSSAIPVAERIHAFNSSIKMIIMVREPVSRSISQYMFGIQRKKISPAAAMEEVIFNDNILNINSRIIRASVYDQFMKHWLKYFNLSQFLIMDSDELKYSPAAALKKVEDFLGLGHYIKPKMFVWNKEKGYNCIRTKLTTANMQCYGQERGKKLPDVNQNTTAILRKFFKPRNEDFFEMIGQSFKWD